MPTHYRDAILTCDHCGNAVERPTSGDYENLHKAGWRWRSNPEERPLTLAPKTFIFSCPDCPAVI